MYLEDYYQLNPKAQSKLVKVKGSVIVIVDLREGSDYFGAFH